MAVCRVRKMIRLHITYSGQEHQFDTTTAIRLHTIYREVASERESSYKVIQKIKMCYVGANVLNPSEQKKSGL